MAITRAGYTDLAESAGRPGDRLNHAENVMLNVFITVDTEAWPTRPDLSPSTFWADIQQDIYGLTPDGEFGLRFQIDLLNRYGLKASYLVESLFADALGPEPLHEIVKVIQDGGHEVQLHLHTEWLERMASSILPGRTGQNIRDFTEDEQATLIARGLKNLRACGARNVCAFRAGNYGANFDTLRALRRNGLLYDTSHNTCYLGSACDLQTKELFLQPKKIDGVYEFPVSFFQDLWRHYRPAQITACSSAEMEYALLEAWRQGWKSFVIVSHSFELIHRLRKKGREALPDRIVVRRFERLCQFLAASKDKFRTAMFSELVPDEIPCGLATHPLRSNLLRTARRHTEQLMRRFSQ